MKFLSRIRIRVDYLSSDLDPFFLTAGSEFGYYFSRVVPDRGELNPSGELAENSVVSEEREGLQLDDKCCVFRLELDQHCKLFPSSSAATN